MTNAPAIAALLIILSIGIIWIGALLTVIANRLERIDKCVESIWRKPQ